MDEFIKQLAQKCLVPFFEVNELTGDRYVVWGGTDEHIQNFAREMMLGSRNTFCVGSVSWNVLDEQIQALGHE